jgi:hypothetical protein
MKFKPLVRAGNLVIDGYVDGAFSLSNSPFYGHKSHSAIDLYSNDREYMGEVQSPVEGIVTIIRRFSPPTSIYFKNPEYEYVIILENSENPLLCYKILHAEPKVSLGQEIKLGDNLGEFIRSGLFCFWTDPHIHLEIRDKPDPIRARGAYELQLIPQEENSRKHTKRDTPSYLSGEVIESRNEYIILKPHIQVFSKVNGFYGLEVEVDHVLGVLDGGVPHYGYAGVLLPDTSKTKQGDTVSFGGVKLGAVTKIIDRNYLQFQCYPLSLHVNEMPLDFRGISSYLRFMQPSGVKLILKTPQDHRIEIGRNLQIDLKQESAKDFNASSPLR